MERKELLEIIKTLSTALLKNKIDSNLYANIVESLIVLNLELVPELEDLADFLAQYHDPVDQQGLYGKKELVKKIKEIFTI